MVEDTEVEDALCTMLQILSRLRNASHARNTSRAIQYILAGKYVHRMAECVMAGMGKPLLDTINQLIIVDGKL